MNPEEATVTFLYSIYQQIRRTDEVPGYTLTQLSIQFNTLCLVVDQEARARRLLVQLLNESAHKADRLAWMWQEMQFEMEGYQQGDRKKLALAELEQHDGPVSDDELDLFNQRMTRNVESWWS